MIAIDCDPGGIWDLDRRKPLLRRGFVPRKGREAGYKRRQLIMGTLPLLWKRQFLRLLDTSGGRQKGEG